MKAQEVFAQWLLDCSSPLAITETERIPPPSVLLRLFHLFAVLLNRVGQEQRWGLPFCTTVLSFWNSALLRITSLLGTELYNEVHCIPKQSQH